MIRERLLRSLFLLVVVTSGCGYHFINQKSEILSGIDSIAIPYFSNNSYQSGLERYLTEALVNEFVKSRIIDIVDEGEADAILRGHIMGFSEQIISFDRNDQALEYRASLTLNATLEKKDTCELLWRNKELLHFEDYRVGQEIAGTEANKEQAIKMIAVEIAERIHDSIIEGF